MNFALITQINFTHYNFVTGKRNKKLSMATTRLRLDLSSAGDNSSHCQSNVSTYNNVGEL